MEALLLQLATSAPPRRTPQLLAAKGTGGSSSLPTIAPRCHCDSATNNRRNKPTYYARKHELEQLQCESAVLLLKLKKLKAAAQRRQHPLLLALANKAALQSRVAQNRSIIAGLQSLLDFNCSSRQIEPPIGCLIHLPHGAIQRQRIVDDMKQPKLREALAYLLQRIGSSDLRSPCRQLENYTTRDGNYVALQWEIVLFESSSGRALTVAQVFDELLAFARDQEMAIAETLGLLSVRESDAGDDDVSAKQLRVVAAHSEQIQTEKNLVQFAECFDKSDLLDAPHGLFVVDYVDQDDLFPYQPATRVRKDIASAKLVVQCSPSSPGEPPVIALVNWAYMAIHKSVLAEPSELDAMAREGLSEYFNALVKVVRERLAWRQHTTDSVSSHGDVA